jgi:diguanylate cyclase (GGDEF)-like protein
MLDKLLSSTKFVNDVLQSLCYTIVLQCGGVGGFVSIAGWDYFDAVIGSYRDKRKGNNKDAIRLWEYPDLERGQIAVVKGVSIYHSHHGWKIGVDRCSISISDFQIAAEKNVSIAYPVYYACLKIEDISQDNDQLTGSLTRRRFFWDMKANIATAQKVGIPLYILYIDLNNFKTVNDYFGHDVGDRVLASIAQEIKSVIAGYGSLYRIGGDEFIAAIFGIDETKALELAKRVEMVTEQAPCGVFVNASVGIKRYDDIYGVGDKAIKIILKESESDMYDNKKNKKKSCIVCENCSYAGTGSYKQLKGETR